MVGDKYKFNMIYAGELKSMIEFVLIKLYCDLQEYEELKSILLNPIKNTLKNEIEKEI